MAKNIKNMLKFVMLKILQDIPLNLKIIQTYFQTLEEVPWLFDAEKT